MKRKFFGSDRGFSRGGQAALEYLMSYSWALALFIAALLALLFFFDVPSFFGLDSEECSFFVLDCQNFLVTEDSILLELSNPNEHEMIVRDIVVRSDALVNPCVANETNRTLGFNDRFAVSFHDVISSNCPARGTHLSRDRYFFNVTYSWVVTNNSEDLFSALLISNSPCSSGAC